MRPEASPAEIVRNCDGGSRDQFDRFERRAVTCTDRDATCSYSKRIPLDLPQETYQGAFKDKPTPGNEIAIPAPRHGAHDFRRRQENLPSCVACRRWYTC